MILAPPALYLESVPSFKGGVKKNLGKPVAFSSIYKILGGIIAAVRAK